MRWKLFAVMLVLIALLGTAIPARAGGVVTVCDEAHLRSALTDGGAVTFACSGVITLSATLFITANTTIDGAGQAVTLDGHHALRIMAVTEGVTLHLRELAFVNGDWAAGGGALYNAGTATVNRCSFTNNGGAIANSGALTVVDSTFTGNSTDVAGGAIYASYYTTLIVSNSTFSANSTRGSGGGAIANNSLDIIGAYEVEQAATVTPTPTPSTIATPTATPTPTATAQPIALRMYLPVIVR